MVCGVGRAEGVRCSGAGSEARTGWKIVWSGSTRIASSVNGSRMAMNEQIFWLSRTCGKPKGGHQSEGSELEGERRAQEAAGGLGRRYLGSHRRERAA
eukprot:3690271-Prymnesium_polylepis.1